MMKSRNKAFTLIELLVVIAIIGILAGVVLASLNSARTKGRYASVKSNLRNAVSQANIYFNDTGSYAGLCADSTIQSIIASLGGSTIARCFASEYELGLTDWGIVASLDGVFFTSGPEGVLQLDTADAAGGSQSLASALAACPAVGKQLVNASSLHALYLVSGGTPTTFSTLTYWSSTKRANIPSQNYIVNMVTGAVATDAGNTRPVRCGS